MRIISFLGGVTAAIVLFFEGQAPAKSIGHCDAAVASRTGPVQAQRKESAATARTCESGLLPIVGNILWGNKKCSK